MKHQRVRKLLHDYASGETDRETARALEHHLESCPQCSAELLSIQQALRQLALIQVDASSERPSEFWTSFTREVGRRVSETGGRAGLRSTPFWFVLEARRFRFVAIGVAVILFGVVLWSDSLLKQEYDSQKQETSRDTLRQDGGARDINRYFHRSRTLLVSLSNSDDQLPEPGHHSFEKELSRELAVETKYWKRQRMDDRSLRLVKDLDKILIKLSNTTRQRNSPEMELIRGGIERENLLFKLRMAEYAHARLKVPSTENSL